MSSRMRCQAITWTNDDLSSVGMSGTNVNDIWINYNDFHVEIY